MAMVDVDGSCLSFGGLTVQVSWLGLGVGGHLGVESAFIKWTGWTLAMALPWWQHHKYHPGYYYYYYYRIRTIPMTLSELQGHSFTHCMSFEMGFFVQLCSRWQDLNWHSASRGSSAIAEVLNCFRLLAERLWFITPLGRLVAPAEEIWHGVDWPKVNSATPYFTCRRCRGGVLGCRTRKLKILPILECNGICLVRCLRNFQHGSGASCSINC